MMTQKKADYPLTEIWQEIEKIIKEPNFQGDKMKISDDFIIYKKITNFLYRGATGTLFEIKEGLGEKELRIFMQYLFFFLNDINHPGHYYPSKLVNSQIRQISESSNLFNIADTLNEISRLEYSKHGENNAKGWMPDESDREKKTSD